MFKRFIFFVAAVFLFASALASAGSKDPIGWAITSPFPTPVLANGGTYTQTYQFTNNLPFKLVHPLEILKTASPSSEFSYTDNCSGQELMPAATCSVGVNLTPLTSGQKTFTLTIAGYSNAQVPLPTVSTTVSGSAGNIVGAFSATNWPASIEENATLVLTPSIFTFTNTGDTEATGVSISCSSNISGCTNTCGSSLAIGQPCTVSGTFIAGSSPGTQVMSAVFAYSQGSTVTASSPPIQVTPSSGFVGVATPSSATVTEGVGTTITFTYTNYDSTSVVIGSSAFTPSIAAPSSYRTFTTTADNCSGKTLTTESPSCTVVGTYTDSTTPVPSSPDNTAVLTGSLASNYSGSPTIATSSLTEAAAPIAGSDYIMWALPASGIGYPVYVYQGGAQVNYIPSSATQAFLGAYPAGVESKTYSLYYQNGGTYNTCNVAFDSSGDLTTDGTTTCSGAAINPPTSSSTATSNVYTLAMGATAFPGTGTPSPTPATPYYSQRGIVFENNTGYYAIYIQGTCSDLSVCSSGYSVTLLNGGSTTISVGNDSLTSSAFYVTAYCTGSSGMDCPDGGSGGDWVSTGGYVGGDNGGYPYATKVEFTFLTPAQDASNLDVSAVDGYNIAVEMYPVTTGSTGPNASDTAGAYCTYTVPPENSNILGAGLYQPSAEGTPIAKIFNADHSGDSLSEVCPGSSSTPNWVLSVTNGSSDFTGCMSPCTYATKNVSTVGTTLQAQYCCSGAYATPAACTLPPSSTYVQNVDTLFQTIYSFAYGDAGADFACEGSNSYVVSFIPSNGITPVPPS